MNHTTLYPDLSTYAHKIVQNIIVKVRELEETWKSKKSLEEPGRARNIENLIDVIMNNQLDNIYRAEKEKAYEVFRFLAASVIYAEVIYNSSSGHGITALSLPERILSDKVTLNHLDKVASAILDKLLEYTKSIDDEEENKRSRMRPVKMKSKHDKLKMRRITGTLAGLKSCGSIPFLRIYTHKNVDVSLRQGFELIEDKPDTAAKQVLDINESLENYPIKTYLNGEHQRVSDKDTLKDIIQDNKFREKVLKGKHITWIHKTLNEFDNDKISYEIEFLVKDTRSLGRKSFIDPPELLEKFAGRKRLMWNDKEKYRYTQQDVIISFFNDILFKSASEDVNFQALEHWAQRTIIEAVSDETGGPIYLGLCYKTLIDGGFVDTNITTGSTNLLLLALTRGFVRLYDNINSQDAKMSLPSCDTPRKAKNLCLKPPSNYKNRIFGCIEDPIHEPKEVDEETEKRRMKEHGLVKVEQQLNDILQNQLFLGANSRGVIVNIQYPKRLVFVILMFIASFLFYAVVIARGTKATQSLFHFVNYCGTLAEVSSSMIALMLILVKIMYRRWEFSDMLHSRRRAQSFSELSRVLPEEREQAIRLLASLENAKKIFSHHRSCAFVHEGQGEFEIDSDIFVRELQDAGYQFGVNFYGDKIVSDLKGKVRKVRYHAKEKVIHIGEEHSLQTKFIYLLPTDNVPVGCNNNKNSTTTRVCDEV